MNIFKNVLNQYSNQQYPTSNLTNPQPWMLNLFGENTSGERVDEHSVMTISAYWDGINLISNHIASLPFSVIQRDYKSGNIEHITDHQLRELLHFQPNEQMTAYTFKKLMTVWMLNWGNAFAKIERQGNKITEIIPKKPWKSSIYQNPQTREVFYRFNEDEGSETKLHPARDVLHLHQFSHDGIKGLSIIEAGARDRMGGHIATEKYGERFYKNNAHMGGILKTNESLGADYNTVNNTKSEIRKEIDQVYGGNDWHKLAILEGDWEYQNITLKASDVQLVERSKATVSDVARWLGIPVSKLKETENQANNSREAEAINYVQDALAPRIAIWQQETRNKMLLEKEKQKGYETQIDSKDLMRSNLKDIGDYLSKMVDRGIFTPNQALKFINEDTFQGGDIHLMQKNMQLLEDVINGTSEEN